MFNFFTTKNLNRIYDEITENKSKNYPFANFKNIEYKTVDLNNFKINIPNSQLWCGNIPMLCSSETYLVKKIIKKNSYIFLLSEEKDLVKFINRTSYYDTIEENDVNREDFKQ